MIEVEKKFREYFPREFVFRGSFNFHNFILFIYFLSRRIVNLKKSYTNIIIIFCYVKRVEEEETGHSNPNLDMTIGTLDPRLALEKKLQLSPHRRLVNYNRASQENQIRKDIINTTRTQEAVTSWVPTIWTLWELELLGYHQWCGRLSLTKRLRPWTP